MFTLHVTALFCEIMSWSRVTINNASDYWTNGHYRTPQPNPSPLVR